MPPKKKTAKAAARQLPTLPAELVEQLANGATTAGEILDITTALKKALIERALKGEVGHHLGLHRRGTVLRRTELSRLGGASAARCADHSRWQPFVPIRRRSEPLDQPINEDSDFGRKHAGAGVDGPQRLCGYQRKVA